MMKPIQTIGILAHPRRPESIPVLYEVLAATQGKGLQCWHYEVWEDEDLLDDLPKTDLVVTIGGDGAILQAARLCSPYRVPVLGLNMGYLGFLAELYPKEWANALEKILAGKFWIEKRSMLHGEVWREDQCLYQADALNDVVISRDNAIKTIHLEAYIGDSWLTNYHADALIIATATGSTAYALAVGGPILPPDLDNIMLIPVAPHLSLDRAVVLSQGANLRIVVSDLIRTTPMIAIDGHYMLNLQVGDEIRVSASENQSFFMRFQERHYFFRSLMDRLEPRFLSKIPPQDKS